MEWSRDTIQRYIREGWSLSFDKTNQRFKLQKRVNGRVKSYTLPKEFNELCRMIWEKRINRASIERKIKEFKKELEGYEREFEYLCPYCFKPVKSSCNGVFKLLGACKSLEEANKVKEKVRKLGGDIPFPVFGAVTLCDHCRNTVYLAFAGYDFSAILALLEQEDTDTSTDKI